MNDADREDSDQGSPAPRDDRIRPLRIPVDERMPPQIASPWRLRWKASGAPDAPRPDGAIRPSALSLRLPDVALLSGERAASYAWLKGDVGRGGPVVVLSVASEGRRRLAHLRREFEGGPGTAVFASNLAQGTGRYQDGGRYLSVTVPSQRLRRHAPNFEAALMQPVASGQALALLVDYVDGLLTLRDGVDRAAAPAVADHLIDLCAMLLGAKGDEREAAVANGFRAAQAQAARRAIDAGAATPGFSAHAVADQIGVPVERLHALLQTAGESFEALALARRLDVVRARLADPAFARVEVREIARACGFQDIRAFRRRFAARFGAAPEAVRKRPGEGI